MKRRGGERWEGKGERKKGKKGRKKNEEKKEKKIIYVSYMRDSIQQEKRRR